MALTESCYWRFLRKTLSACHIDRFAGNVCTQINLIDFDDGDDQMLLTFWMFVTVKLLSLELSTTATVYLRQIFFQNPFCWFVWSVYPVTQYIFSYSSKKFHRLPIRGLGITQLVTIHESFNLIDTSGKIAYRSWVPLKRCNHLLDNRQSVENLYRPLTYWPLQSVLLTRSVSL